MLLWVMLAAGFALPAGASPTANYYRQHLAAALDHEALLHVVQLTPLEVSPGFVRYYADTADGSHAHGGTITILIPTNNVRTKEDRELFASRLRQFEDYFRLTRTPVAAPHETGARIPLRGTLVQHGATLALVFNLYPRSVGDSVANG